MFILAGLLYVNVNFFLIQNNNKLSSLSNLIYGLIMTETN